MDEMLVKALLYLAKYCVSCNDCAKCALHAFCGKTPIEW